MVNITAEVLPEQAAVEVTLTGGVEGDPMLLLRRDASGVNVVRETSELTVEYAPHPRVNLATNPSAETAGALVTVRENLLPNPSFDTVPGGWGGYGSTSLALDTTRSTSGPGSCRLAASVSNDANRGLTVSGLSVAGGQTVTVSADVWLPSGTPASGVRFWLRDDGSGSMFAAPSVQPVKGHDGWHRYSYTHTIPSNLTLTRVYIFVTAPSGAAWLGGEQVWFDSALLEVAPEPGPYFDGSTPAAGDFSFSWAGTAHASTSRQQAPSLTDWTAVGATLVQRHDGGDPHFQMVAGENPYASHFTPGGTFAEGDVATVALDVWAPVAGTAARLSMQWAGASGALVTHHGSGVEVPAGSRGRLTLTVPPAPAGTTRARLLLYPWANPGTSTPALKQVLNFDNVMVEKGSTDGAFTAPGETVAVVTDFEAQQGEQTDYIVADPDGQAQASVRVALPRWGTWLKHPGRPHLNTRLWYVTDEGFGREARQDTLAIRGASFPVVLSDRRLAPAGTVTLLGRTADDRRRVTALVNDGGTLLLDLDPDFGVPVRYVSVGTVTEQRAITGDLKLDREARHFALPVQAVAVPIGVPVAQAARYEGLPGRFATYATIGATVDDYESIPTG